ncbi:MAG: cell division protein FtsA [Opitutales bacterium]
MSQPRVVAAVEIGTSKIAVLLGKLEGNTNLEIVGHSLSTSKGVKKGEIRDLRAVSDCVHSALGSAESKASQRIDEVYLALSGRHLEGNFNVGTATVSDAAGRVRQMDVEQAKADAKRRELPEDRSYIHHIQNPFRLDGKPVESPLEQEGQRLEVGYWSVHADTAQVRNCLRIISGYGMDVSDIVISSLASGVILAEEAEKNAGVLVIDIGGGTTDWVLYRGGFVVRTGVVAVGGDHITNDLSAGLRIGRKRAEQIKLENGRAYFESGDRNEKVWLIGDYTIGDKEFPKAAVTRIIEARVNEIFEIVKSEIKKAGFYDPAEIASGVILTGGTARLEGLDQIAERVLDLRVRFADFEPGIDPELRKPEYTTVIGLLDYALQGQEHTQDKHPGGGILGGLFDILGISRREGAL